MSRCSHDPKYDCVLDELPSHIAENLRQEMEKPRGHPYAAESLVLTLSGHRSATRVEPKWMGELDQLAEDLPLPAETVPWESGRKKLVVAQSKSILREFVEADQNGSHIGRLLGFPEKDVKNYEEERSFLLRGEFQESVIEGLYGDNTPKLVKLVPYSFRKNGVGLAVFTKVNEHLTQKMCEVAREHPEYRMSRAVNRHIRYSTARDELSKLARFAPVATVRTITGYVYGRLKHRVVTGILGKDVYPNPYATRLYKEDNDE